MRERTEREERDDFLVMATMVGAASTLLTGYKGWLLEEVKELILRCSVCSATCGEPLHTVIEQRIKRLEDIRDYEINEAAKTLRDKIADMNQPKPSFDHVIDARHYLEDGVYRLEGLVRECLEARRLLDGLEDDDDPEDDGSADEGD